MTFLLTRATLSTQPNTVRLTPNVAFAQATAGAPLQQPAQGFVTLPSRDGDTYVGLATDADIAGIDTTSGRAQLVGKAPDGDTIRIEDRKGNGVAVRYLHMDARETHFAGYSQGDMADRQTDANLTALGVQAWDWAPGRSTLRAVTPEDLQVRLLVNGTDRYGRLLGMPIRHDANVSDIPDGPIEPWNQDFVSLIRASANYSLVEAGMAYATFYEGVTPVEIALFLSATNYAQSRGLGIWEAGADHTYHDGFYVRSLGDMRGNVPIHPVIFRRLVAFLKTRGDFDGPAFLAYLRANPDSLRRINRDLRTNNGLLKLASEPLRDILKENILEPERYHLHDLIELMPTDATRGGRFRVVEPLEHFVRF